MPREQDNAKREAGAAARLSRTVWRWHFGAGILVAPVLLIASITGALYVFRSELEGVLYRDLVRVESGSQASQATYEQQHQAAESEVPEGSKLLFLVIPEKHEGAPHKTTLFRYKLPDGDQRYVYIDPYAAMVTGTIDRSRQFFEIVLRIHRRLFAGNTGRVLVELATSWGVVLVLSGLYLWMPKNPRTPSRGVWWPRLQAGRYTVLRDLHAVPAAYLSLFLLLVLMTGLFFSLVWGTGYRLAAFKSGGFPEVFTDPPHSSVPDDLSPETPSITIDEAVATAERYGFDGSRLTVSVPDHDDDTYSVSATPWSGAVLSGLIHLDRYSGDVIYDSKEDSVPAMTTALLYALPIHQGSIFGTPTKLLALASALVLTTLVLTGCWMWWARKPKGRLGLPKRYDDVVLPRWMLAVILLLGVCLPVMGASLLIAMAADFAWTRIQRQKIA